MTASDPNPSKGQEFTDGGECEDQPDWEALARREIGISLQTEAEDGVAEAATAVGHRIREGKQAAEALQEFRLEALAFEERAREVLYDMGELDRYESQEKMVTAVLAYAHIILSSSCDIEKEREWLERVREIANERHENHE